MDIPRISMQEAKRLFDTDPGTVFLDTRSPDAWAKATDKLPGALRVPPAEVEAHLGEIPRDRPIVAYCT